MTLPAITLRSATNAAVARRTHHDLAAREALADVVVRVALEAQRDAARQERAEATAPRSRVSVTSIEPDGRPVLAAAHGDLVAEHRADGALGVRDRQLDLDRAAVLEHDAAAADELVVEVLVELVVLLARVAARLGRRRSRARRARA